MGLLCCCVAFAMSAGVHAADTMVVASETHTGTFEGYRQNRFLFRTESGTLLQEVRGRVSELKLGQPCKVTFARTGRKKREPAHLKTYAHMKFTFEDGGREKVVPAFNIREITVQRDESGGAAKPDDGAKPGGAPDKPGVFTTYDVRPLASRSDLTGPQSAALKRYETAKSRYDAFLKESTRLVTEMDRAKGAQREKLLNELRTRKNQEQPIKKELDGATAALLSAFPWLKTGQAPPEQAAAATGGLFALVLVELPDDAAADELVKVLKNLGLRRELASGDAPPVTLPGTAFGGFVGDKSREAAHDKIDKAVSGTMRAHSLRGRYFVLVSPDVNWSSGGVALKPNDP